MSSRSRAGALVLATVMVTVLGSLNGVAIAASGPTLKIAVPTTGVNISDTASISGTVSKQSKAGSVLLEEKEAGVWVPVTTGTIKGTKVAAAVKMPAIPTTLTMRMDVSSSSPFYSISKTFSLVVHYPTSVWLPGSPVEAYGHPQCDVVGTPGADHVTPALPMSPFVPALATIRSWQLEALQSFTGMTETTH